MDILDHRIIIINSEEEYWINMYNDLMSEKNIQYFEDIDKKILSLSPSDK